MKVKLILLSLLCSLASYGQMQDLMNLSKGEIVYSSILYDSNENLYGYFYLYQTDKTSSKTMKFEYVVLDKNLNKVNNGEFEGMKEDYLLYSRFDDCTLMGDKLILDKIYYSQEAIILNTIRIISLKDNNISNEKRIIDGKFTDFDPITELKKIRTKATFSTSYERSFINSYCNEQKSGMFVHSATLYGTSSYSNPSNMNFYNSDLKQDWTIDCIKVDSIGGIYTNFIIKSIHDSIIYAQQTYTLKKTTYTKVLAFSIKTGNKIWEYTISGNKDKPKIVRYLNYVPNGKNLFIMGEYYNDKGIFGSDRGVGFYKIELDSAGHEIQRVNKSWLEMKSDIKISKKGKTPGSYELVLKRVAVLNDQSTLFITEMYHPSSYPIWFIPIIGWFARDPAATKNMILFHFDKDFNLLKSNTIEKTTTYDNSSDYLFSQKIKDGDGLAFFYINNKKDAKTGKRNNVLGINSFINGTLTTEEIPLSAKKEFQLIPMPAKEGYIMLREYNQKAKYNQIRLEKLNY
jgi:hypothetical protein